MIELKDKWKTLLLACLMVLCMFSIAYAGELTEGDYKYTLAGGEATVTGYTGAGGSITIPATLGSCPVTTLGAYAFYDKNLTSILKVGPSAPTG